MKTIRVVAAVIKAVKEDGRTMIFATQRGYGEFKGGWECNTAENSSSIQQ